MTGKELVRRRILKNIKSEQRALNGAISRSKSSIAKAQTILMRYKIMERLAKGHQSWRH